MPLGRGDLELALRVRADLRQAVGELNRLTAAVGKTDANTRRGAKANRELSRTVQRVARDAQQAARSLDRLDREQRQTAAGAERMERAARGAGSAWRRFRTLVAAGGLGLLLREVVQAGIEFEAFEQKLRFATGSAAGATAELAFLRAEANRLGIDFNVLAESYSNFAAATRDTPLEQQTREIFTAFAEGARVLRLTREQTRGLFLALEQIVSKGVVSAEELRQQLGERLPGALQIAARALGVTTEELNRMLASGELLSTEFLPLFAAEARRTFGADVPEAANKADASIARLGNAFRDLKVRIAESGVLDLTAALAEAAAAGIHAANEADRTLGQRLQERVRMDRLRELLAEQADLRDQINAALDRDEALYAQYLRQRLEGLADDVRDAARAVRAVSGAPPPLGEIPPVPVGGRRPRPEPPHPEPAPVDPEFLARLEKENRAILGIYDRRRASAAETRDTLLGYLSEQTEGYAEHVAAVQTWYDTVLKGIAEDEAADAERRAEAKAAARQREIEADERAAASAEDAARRAREAAAREAELAYRSARDALTGAHRALGDIAELATDAGAEAESAIVNAFHGIEDAFERLRRTGKASFGDLVDSVLADVTRLLLRLQVTGPLALFLQSLLGGAGQVGLPLGDGSRFAGFAHGGGIAGSLRTGRRLDAAAFAFAPRLHRGGSASVFRPAVARGIPGLRDDEIPTILERGEGVFTREQMAALGGLAGGPREVVVQIRNESSQEIEASDATAEFDGMRRMVVGVVLNDLQHGGDISRALHGGFGLRRRPI
ncbi:MAG: tape measure protein [Gammaproteobacteria bacterium]|nr:tape measure protein [Gammaproteobacteria bacterium]